MTSKSSGQFNNIGGKGLGDYKHAARVFVDGDFALAPRLKFQYHVQFSGKGCGADLNVLVKSVDLPKFQVTNETVNQYNRKRVIQSTMTYLPITIKMHDDNSNTVRKLWESYYKYYFSDTKAAKNGLYKKSPWAPMSFYGLENEPVKPFLDFIKVHTFAKRQWVGYKLINPIIISWSHDTMSYSQSEGAEHTMTIAYEAVVYDSGSAAAGTPSGFGQGRYDQTPSPLTLGGRTSISAVDGTSGVITGAEQIFGSNLKDIIADATAINASASATAQTNLYNNTQMLTNAGKTTPNGNTTISALQLTLVNVTTGNTSVTAGRLQAVQVSNNGSLKGIDIKVAEISNNKTNGILKSITGK